MEDSPAAPAPVELVVTGDLPIRQLLRLHPLALLTLVEHGWQPRWIAAGSDPTLADVARDCSVEPDVLGAAIQRRLELPSPGHDSGPAGPSPLVFIAAGLFATFSGGSMLGSINQVQARVYLLELGALVKQLHADFQLTGLVAFILGGLSLHLMPRIMGSGVASARATRAFLWLLILSLGLNTASIWAGPWLAIGAALISAVAGTIVAREVTRCHAESGRPWQGLDFLLVMGAWWWPIGKALWALAFLPGQKLFLPSARAGEQALVFGVFLSWVLFLLPRGFPRFGRLLEPSSGRAWLVAGLLHGGVAVGAAGLAILGPGRLASAGLAAVVLGLLTFITTDSGRGGAHGAAGGPAPWQPPSAFWLKFPLTWARLGVIMLGAAAVVGLAGDAEMPFLFMDAARHTLSSGFCLGALLGATVMVLPWLTGAPDRSPPGTGVGLFAFHVGILARWAQVLWGQYDTTRVSLFGWFGFLVTIGLLPWAVALLRAAWLPRERS